MAAKKQKMEGEGKGEEDERPTICFVTGNANKLREVKAIFGDDFPFRMVNRKTHPSFACSYKPFRCHSFTRHHTARSNSFVPGPKPRTLAPLPTRSLPHLRHSLSGYLHPLISLLAHLRFLHHCTEKIDLPELQGEPEEVSTEKCKLAAAHAQCAVMTEDTSLVRQQRGQGWDEDL